MSDNIAELVSKLDKLRANLVRSADGAAFVQDGFVRVTDPDYLLECLAEAAQALTRIAGELRRVEAENEAERIANAQLFDRAYAAEVEWGRLKEALIYIDAYIAQAASIGAAPVWTTIADRAREALRGEKP